MMDWKTIAFTAPILFIAYQALSKLIPSGVSVFLVNAYASLAGAIIMVIVHLATSENKSFSISGKVFLISIAIGTLISLGNYLIIKAYSLGAPQSLFTALFYPLMIIGSLVVGLLIWSEKLNLLQVMGIMLSVLGILLVAYFKK